MPRCSPPTLTSTPSTSGSPRRETATFSATFSVRSRLVPAGNSMLTCTFAASTVGKKPPPTFPSSPIAAIRMKMVATIGTQRLLRHQAKAVR